MSFLNQIALSGVRAAQVGLTTTGQNIANVNTPGFSRLNSVTASLAGPGGLNVGGGVEVTSIRRIANEFHNQQLWRATTEQNYFSTRQDYHTALETLMSGDGSSLSTGLDQFFAAVSEASAAPESIALRQQVLAEAGNLAQRFNALGGNINAQILSVQAQRTSMVTTINGLADNIAKINKQIVEAEASKGDTTALRDHRDSLLKEMSQYASVRVNETADGAVNVSLSNGQPLVSGKSAGELQITMLATGEQQVSLNFIGTSFPLRQDTFGGAFGGLYDAEYSDLRAGMASLHAMADQFTQAFNSTIQSGFDLSGNPGQALLTYDPTSSNQLLKVNALTPEQLAFSDTAGESGNNKVLLQLLDIKNQNINLNGSSVTLNDAYTGWLGQVASNSRQNQADLESSTQVTAQAQAQRDSTSAVSLDEEAVNLMTYQQAYQANMKVIATANQLFDEMLAAF